MMAEQQRCIVFRRGRTRALHPHHSHHQRANRLRLAVPSQRHPAVHSMNLIPWLRLFASTRQRKCKHLVVREQISALHAPHPPRRCRRRRRCTQDPKRSRHPYFLDTRNKIPTHLAHATRTMVFTGVNHLSVSRFVSLSVPHLLGVCVWESVGARARSCQDLHAHNRHRPTHLSRITECAGGPERSPYGRHVQPTHTRPSMHTHRILRPRPDLRLTQETKMVNKCNTENERGQSKFICGRQRATRPSVTGNDTQYDHTLLQRACASTHHASV